MKIAVETFSDFHITLSVMYYDQYEYSSFINAGEEILKQEPDGGLPVSYTHLSTVTGFTQGISCSYSMPTRSGPLYSPTTLNGISLSPGL